ncbi:sulfite exporter TauE/SafE family protein [Clostridia bacterium]|nr:sulfite exporter TauE/SafE family protein [Clostridia bacterium]
MKSNNTITGWEVSIENESHDKKTRMQLSRREIRASLVSLAILVLVGLLGYWLANCPFEGTIRISSPAILAKGWTKSTWGIAWEVVLFAIIFEFLDSTAGMGYGTAFTPLLLVMGYDPMQIVPVIMIQQACAGLTSAYMHQEYGNIEWKIKPLSESVKLWLIIAGAGSLATIFSITSVYALLKLANVWIKLYVIILLITMGLISLIKATSTYKYRPQRMIFFGALAGLNKGIGGGGYGPVLTIGGILSGIPVKSMIAVTALSEGTVCVTSIIIWAILMNAGLGIDFVLLPSMMIGSVLAVLAAPYVVRVLPEKRWKVFIPIYCLLLASISLWKLWPTIYAILLA